MDTTSVRDPDLPGPDLFLFGVEISVVRMTGSSTHNWLRAIVFCDGRILL